MLKLTVNGEERSFESDVVVIGRQGDISLEALKETHIKIEKVNDRHLCTNEANDPFATLNGLPFGKKILNENDEIQLGQTVIRFSEKTQPPEPIILDEFDDELESWRDDKPIEEEGPEISLLENSNWKLFATFLFALITLSTIVASGVYFRASGKNSQEEKKVAAGVADISMALIHAELNHIMPKKRNWSDPDFINNNLSMVLSPDLHSQASINDQGEFNHFPYILRVYTSSDLARFLVIAQPAPNLFQWLIHKKSIAIDSTSMELRKISDIKALNRLLANPDPLSGANGNEISRIVKDGILMPIPSLGGKKNKWGFTAPSALGLLRPGAENFVYNAPRYFPFSEGVLESAVELAENPGSSYEVSMLHQELDKISQFPDLVLYSSKGMQMAIEAQKALQIFAPLNHFLVAYLKLNAKGIVISSHLLMDDEGSEIALGDPFSLIKKRAQEDKINLDPEQTIYDNNPLYLQLHAIKQGREKALTPIGEEMVALINQQTNDVIPDFYRQLEFLIEKYEENDKEQKRKMVQALVNLYEEYSELPIQEFMRNVRNAELETFVRASLHSHKEHLGKNLLAEEQIQRQLKKIEKTREFEELKYHVKTTADILSLERLPDPELLGNYQALVQQKTLAKLREFILSADSPIPPESFTEENRENLVEILRKSWVTDQDEREYFLEEFESIALISPSGYN